MKKTQSPEDNTDNTQNKNNILTFFQMLFDFSFSKFITVQMFPALYFVILASTLFAILYLCFEAFLTSIARGMFFLFIAGPITFIAIATVVRALMEFYIVVFRIAENIDDMRLLSNKLTGLTDTMDGVKGLTRKLPFWNIMGYKNTSKESENTNNTDQPQSKSSSTKSSNTKKPRKNTNWPY
ncbi:MAG: DUF4282 domain-containing protein [Pseudomonadales bacterium]|nr:DUF4282 domain-containing protein [Pseudomonadales bacterium]